MAMAEELERRENHRFRIDLAVQVTAKGADGVGFTDQTVLRNMSGGGANFITGQADRYFKGQQLAIEIDLPGTDELRASLRGNATVLRIEPLPEAGPQQADRKYAVAVMITVPLQLIRKDAAGDAARPTVEST